MGPRSLDLSIFKVFDKESGMKVVRASKANIFILHVRKLALTEDNGVFRSDSKLDAELSVERRSPPTIQQWVQDCLEYHVFKL